jgi:uncharacterized repeat protein (TIGR01451 family)
MYNRRFYRTLFAVTLLVGAFVFLYAVPVSADAEVNDCSTYDDSNSSNTAVTLKEALDVGGTITFSCSGTIIVPAITISSTVTLDASGQTIALDGNLNNRVLVVTSSGNLTLINLTVQRGRTEFAPGAGIYNVGGTVTIIRSTIGINNWSIDGDGAGIYNDGGIVTLTDSAVYQNQIQGADADGEGIYNRNGTLTVTNTSFFGFFDPIYNDGGTATITNSTIRSPFGGVNNAGGTVNLRNSIVDGICGGTINHGGYPNYGCGGSVTGDLLLNDTSLGRPLYWRMNPGSVAFDTGDNSVCPPTDRRGAPRPMDRDGDGIAECDLGAVEEQPANRLRFNQQPTNTGMGALIVPGVHVVVVDVVGDQITDDNTTQITIAIGSNPSGGTLSGTLNATAVKGFASFDDLRVSQVGTGYTLVATASGLTSATSSTFNITGLACPAFPYTVPAGSVTDLITAIICANASPTDDVINLTNSTYTLNAVDNPTDGGSGLPVILPTAISGGLTINGNGATITRDSAAPPFRILNVNSSANLTLNGLTLSGGSSANGSALLNNGTLTITSSTVSGNTAVFGGGIYNNGTLTITSSTVSGNTAQVVGGGIYNLGTLTITSSTISGNSAFDWGGCGGGVLNGGTLTITNSTFSGNTASGDAGCGGGITNSGGTATITNSTIAGNSAAIAGGISSSSGTVYLRNSIVYGNTSPLVGDCPSNISHDGYPNIGCGGSVTGDPLLGVFTNGYYPLLPGSAALDVGNNSVCPAQDQIGTPRPLDAEGSLICDLGAIEAQFGLPTLNISDVTLSEGTGGTTLFAVTVSLSSPAQTGGVVFDITTADNTATTADSDYTAQSITGVTIPAGGESYTFNVAVNGDAQPESDETFFVTITNIVGASAGDTQAVGTISDDDTLPSLSALKTVMDVNSGVVLPGDTLRWTITVSNNGGAAYNVQLTDALDANTTLVPGTTTLNGTLAADFGGTMAINSAGESAGVIAAGANAVVTFDVQIIDPLPAGVFSISNQAVIVANGGINLSTDDDGTGMDATTVLVGNIAIVSIFQDGITPIANNTGTAVFSGMVGTPLISTFSIRNTGIADLTLTEPVTLTGTGFTLLSSFGSTTVTPNTETDFTVQCDAVTDGVYTGGISFTTNAPNASTFTFALECEVATDVQPTLVPTTAPPQPAFPTPQPVPPCALIGGGTNSIVRVNIPAGLNADVFCRILNENGVYIRDAAEVGDQTLINVGILQAVDVFGFTSGGVQVTTLNQPIRVCLQGSGRMFFRDATTAPRVTIPVIAAPEGGYTCGSIPNAGTVVLVR